MGIARSLAAASLALIAGQALAATHTVQVNDNFFSPSSLTICQGDTVTWQWVGSVPHSTTSGDNCGSANGAWDSGIMSSGTYSVTFNNIPQQCASDSAPGDNVCAYFCSVHCSAMTGTLTIMSNASTGALGISRNKLRITTDPMEGRGGTTIGVEMLDGATYADVVPGTSSVTLTLSAPMLGSPLVATVALSESRGSYVASMPSDPSKQLNPRSVQIKPVSADTAKMKITWETHGVDLTAIGPPTLTVTSIHGLPGNCGVGQMTSTASAPVAD